MQRKKISEILAFALAIGAFSGEVFAKTYAELERDTKEFCSLRNDAKTALEDKKAIYGSDCDAHAKEQAGKVDDEKCDCESSFDGVNCSKSTDQVAVQKAFPEFTWDQGKGMALCQGIYNQAYGSDPTKPDFGKVKVSSGCATALKLEIEKECSFGVEALSRHDCKNQLDGAQKEFEKFEKACNEHKAALSKKLGCTDCSETGEPSEPNWLTATKAFLPYLGGWMALNGYNNAYGKYVNYCIDFGVVCNSPNMYSIGVWSPNGGYQFGPPAYGAMGAMSPGGFDPYGGGYGYGGGATWGELQNVRYNAMMNNYSAMNMGWGGGGNGMGLGWQGNGFYGNWGPYNFGYGGGGGYAGFGNQGFGYGNGGWGGGGWGNTGGWGSGGWGSVPYYGTQSLGGP